MTRKYTVSKATIHSLEELSNVSHVDHVELVIEGSYRTVGAEVYKAARLAGRYVSPGQRNVHGVLTFHLFPNEPL